MSDIKLDILSGVRENGKNMYAVEVDDQIFILDCGLMYPENELLGIDIVIPNLEYLEEKYPDVALLPQDFQQRALIRAVSQSIACDIHPLNNLRVLQYLSNTLAISDEQKTTWYRHWIETGFKALEIQLKNSNGQFCFGETASFADCCLIPQVYNALRFKIDLALYPKIQAIYQHCNTLSAFQNAAPETQADAA